MKCKNCQEGNVLIQHIITVSRDMAMDAGDLSLEGTAWDCGSEWIGCECCQGEWQDCPTCNSEAQSNTVLRADKRQRNTIRQIESNLYEKLIILNVGSPEYKKARANWLTAHYTVQYYANK